jgi:four helix bundle protein
LIVWQKSMDLFVDIHKITKKMPIEERYELSSQIRRSAFSIPANIAEGSAKSTNAHYRQFLETSLGSAYETETALIALTTIYGSLENEINEFLEKISEIQRMLTAFLTKLK